MNQPGLKLSISGLRAPSPEVLDSKLAYQAALLFLRAIPEGPIVVSRDPRPTGEALLRAVEQACHDSEREVLRAGIVPLPTTALAVVRHMAAGAIMVTASHNPVEYNGLKFLDNEGRYIGAETLDRLRLGLAAAELEAVPEQEIEGLDIQESAITYHHAKARARVQEGKKLVVALDAVNGAGSQSITQFLESIDCEVLPIATDVTQPFPHVPEPTPENLVWTQEQLQGKTYDFCAVVDPDADRLVLIDETGELLSEERTLPLIALHLRDTMAGKVVINLSTSGQIKQVLEGSRLQVERSPVGEANVVRHMEQIGAVFGGEGNGGVIDPEIHYGRDALAGIVHIINVLRAHPDSTLHTLVSELPPAHMKKTKIPAPEVFDAEHIASELAQKFPNARIDRQDGVHITWQDDSWAHVRTSNTEPIVRIIAEAETAALVDQRIAEATEAMA